MKVLSVRRGPWTCSTPSLPTFGTSPIHLARLPGPESQSAYFVPLRRRRHVLHLEREDELLLALQVERERALGLRGGAGAVERDLADRASAARRWRSASAWRSPLPAVLLVVVAVEDEQHEHDDDDREHARARSAPPRRPATRPRPRRRDPRRAERGPAPERARGLSRSGRGRGAGASGAGSSERSRRVRRGAAAGAASAAGCSSVAGASFAFAAALAGSSGTVAPLTSTSCARTVSAHSRAPLELRSIRRVAWRGLPFCWPSRKSAIWRDLVGGQLDVGREGREAGVGARPHGVLGDAQELGDLRVGALSLQDELDDGALVWGEGLERHGRVLRVV